jgi:hypothetical protein
MTDWCSRNGMILIGKQVSAGRKTCPSASLYTASATLGGLRLNPGLRLDDNHICWQQHSSINQQDRQFSSTVQTVCLTAFSTNSLQYTYSHWMCLSQKTHIVMVTGSTSSLTLQAEHWLRVQGASSSRLQNTASWGASWSALLLKYYYGHTIEIRPAVKVIPAIKWPSARYSQTSMFGIPIFRDHSVFRSSVITHFNIIVATLRDWFRRIRIRQCVWSVGFPHPPATAQITSSSAKLCLPPNAVDCFSARQNKTCSTTERTTRFQK